MNVKGAGMDFFNQRVAEVILGHEGGYADNPSDPGGETNWGITKRVAEEYGYHAPMRLLTRERALVIYRLRYFEEPRINSVATFAQELAIKLVDVAVNQGPHYAGEFLQTLLNVLNRQGRDYPDIRVDGQIGPATIRALNDYMAVRKAQGGEAVLVNGVRFLQGHRYINLPTTNPKLEDFMFGWLRRAAS